MLEFQNVKVPWEKVIVHDNPALSRNIYIQTPSHVMANHQCNVRFGAKLRFMLAMASLITQATGARDIPVVRRPACRHGSRIQRNDRRADRSLP